MASVLSSSSSSPTVHLPDEHLIKVGLLAVRAATMDRLLEMLFQGWFADLPGPLWSAASALSLEQKADSLCEVLQHALPEDSGFVRDLFEAVRAAREEKDAILHEIWVFSEILDIDTLKKLRTGLQDGSCRVTAAEINDLDRRLAALLLDLTMVFGKAVESRAVPPPASPDTPERPNSPAS